MLCKKKATLDPLSIDKSKFSRHKRKLHYVRQNITIEDCYYLDILDKLKIMKLSLIQ